MKPRLLLLLSLSLNAGLLGNPLDPDLAAANRPAHAACPHPAPRCPRGLRGRGARPCGRQQRRGDGALERPGLDQLLRLP